jgi:hypothetical protein
MIQAHSKLKNKNLLKILHKQLANPKCSKKKITQWNVKIFE